MRITRLCGLSQQSFIYLTEKEMPTLESELILTPEKTRIRVAIEPAVNALGSLMFLSRVDDYSGLDPWVVKIS